MSINHNRTDNAASTKTKHARLKVLDGWRGISILSVLAAHMLPVGSKVLQLNAACGLFGMSIFFTLSGFLITCSLHRNRNIKVFFSRRFTRILPLAYLYLIVTFIVIGRPIQPISFLFVQNYIYSGITPITSHFWSLCVEIHFYIAIGLFMAITRFRGADFLFVLLALLIANRIFNQIPYNIKTHLRVDEIISGACLALIYLKYQQTVIVDIITRIPFWVLLLLLFLSCHMLAQPFMYFRGVFASLLVGHTLFTPTSSVTVFLQNKVLKYLAQISYALYIWHPITMYGWLGDGGTVIKYLKRPLCFVLSFSMAHLSTYYYELPITKFGKKIH